MGIEFIKKNACNIVSKGASDANISFRIVKHSKNSMSENQRYYGSVGFPVEIGKKISSTGYIAVGIDKKRGKIYFREEDGVTGYKLSTNNTTTRLYIKFSLRDVTEWARFVGIYALEFDEGEKMYCITAKKEK